VVAIAANIVWRINPGRLSSIDIKHGIKHKYASSQGHDRQQRYDEFTHKK
jgi:hypothetical protein